MANNHWSQFSYEPTLLIFSPVLVTITFLMLFASQKFGWLLFVLAIIWIYVLVFKYYFKMPISYTPNLIRRTLTGKNKKPKNWRDSLEL